MEPYNLFADLLSTFRSLNDGIKALMVIGFYAAPVGLAWAWAYAKRGRAPQETPEPELDALAEDTPNRAALDAPPVEVKPVDAEPADPARLAAPDARGPRIEKL